MSQQEYHAAAQRVEAHILRFLRIFEDIQDTLHFGRVPDAQARLCDTLGDFFDTDAAAFSGCEPPSDCMESHAALTAALTHLQNAHRTFLDGVAGPTFGNAFVSSRFSLCRGLSVLYAERKRFPTLYDYWVLPDTANRRAELEQTSAKLEVGILHRPASNAHNEYSLYVPEYYTPATDWPLIICLHGGYGRADDYMWTWLRPAKSRGYLVLSPKSRGPTWSVPQPRIDIASVRAMFDAVCARYAVDRTRVYVSGLSDGGTFTYLLGLDQADLFAGIAPIAGELSPAADGMLRQKQGLQLPIHVIHGAHDFIFPVASVRSSNELLTHIGYRLTYTELPDWSHSLTHAVNETLVLPWFESLTAGAQV